MTFLFRVEREFGVPSELSSEESDVAAIPESPDIPGWRSGESTHHFVRDSGPPINSSLMLENHRYPIPRADSIVTLLHLKESADLCRPKSGETIFPEEVEFKDPMSAGES